ncbi:hypothetical protein BH23PAT2_BH23PAT2_03590 [soil metagenome]
MNYYKLKMNPDEQDQNDYTFIQQDTQPIQMGPDKKHRIIIAAVGGGLVLLIFGVFFSVLLGSGSSSADTYTKIARTQEEIIRIADIGTNKARSQEVLNLSATTIRSINSSKLKTLARLKTLDKPLSPAQLRAGEKASITKDLETAEQAGNFDEVFLGILKAEIKAYQELLSRSYDNATTKSEQGELQKMYADAELLLSRIEN